MILRDQFGEIETGIGDLFEYQGATLSVVCQDSTASQLFGKTVICVRLFKGILDHKGQQFQIEEGKNPPIFIFESELVASCFRQQEKWKRAPQEQHPPEFEAIPSANLQPARNEAKTGRARKSKADPVQDQPTLW